MGLYFRMIKCSKFGCDVGSQVYVKPQGQNVQKTDAIAVGCTSTSVAHVIVALGL